MRFPKWAKTGTFLLLWGSLSALATPEEADKSEERARSSFVDQFSKFMQDKNVQGRAKTPDGQIVQGGKKTRFNQDNGLAFQSDLTYHDYAFGKGIEIDQGKGKPPKRKFLQPFVSDHGSVSAAGGSSLLERTAYALDDKLTKQDEQNKDKPAQEGVRFRSIYKITTKTIFDQQAAAAANTPGAPPPATPEETEEEKPKVDRYELRDEARPEIEKVGEVASQTILQAARGEQSANDPQALGNGVLLRQAAASATQALWNSTLSNLAQNRAKRTVRGGGFDTPELSEGTARCEDWNSAAMVALNGALQKAGGDASKAEAIKKEIERISKQCKEVSALPYNVIDPVYEKQEDGTEVLKSAGPEKESAFQRDSRLQLEVMAKAGKSVTELPSNWQFSKKDDKARMTISYDDNQPQEGALTIKEQLESYNANLKDAEEGYQDVKNRFPDLEMAKPTDYAIQPGTKNIVDINQPPEAAFEEVGLENKTRTGPTPKTYNDLLREAQTN